MQRCNFNPDSGGGCNDLQRAGNRYGWNDAMAEWISRLNGPTDTPDAQSGFGGHTDWRLPTIVELQTILDCGFGPPCIDPIFGPTSSSNHWSSSSSAFTPGFAWLVRFSDGITGFDIFQTNSHGVRAVRGGL